MEESLFSPSWYRVAKLKPRLRSQSEIHRHVYRTELWYILQDQATGRHFRFSPVAYEIIGLMDGKRTVQELWEESNRRFGDDAPSQGEMIRLLGQLHSADLLLCDLTPDTLELLRRSERLEKAKRFAKWRSPLFLKFPLWDPEVFLKRTFPYLKFLFNRWFFLCWLVVVLWGCVVAGLNWSELTNNIVDQVFSAQNLLVLWLVYPLIKALHELAHGYAIKSSGGEVHEMGIMLLVLMPIPYVEASAASSFRNKWARVLTGGAGIMIELLVASVALQVWVLLEPGLMRSVAFNVILVGSVSTLIFNGNPLLRYDGYYMLMDWLEIPNLAQRSYHYLAYLTKRYILGVSNLQPPHIAPGEQGWLFVYSIAAFIYRLFVYAAIIMFIAGKFFIVGVLLAIWAALNMIVWPLLKKIHFLLFSPTLRANRGRSVGIALSGVIISLALFFVLPFPHWTNSEGVVWVGEDSLVRAGVEGFVSNVVTSPGTVAAKGDVLIVFENPELEAEEKIYEARLNELNTKIAMATVNDRVRRNMLLEESRHVKGSLDRIKDMLDQLTIHASKGGVFILPNAEDLPDRFVPRGTLIGYILANEKPLVRTVVSQNEIDAVRQKTRQVRIRFADKFSNIALGEIQREVPSASDTLPSTILGFGGGGAIAIDPTDQSGVKTFDKQFQFDIKVSSEFAGSFIGNRAYVRFEHEPEPLGFQLVRKVRQILLRRFNV